MDKDKSQMDHFGSLHHRLPPEDSLPQNANELPKHTRCEKEAEMDMLEARLFAMTNSRNKP